jgi:hypothetical protein
MAFLATFANYFCDTEYYIETEQDKYDKEPILSKMGHDDMFKEDEKVKETNRMIASMEEKLETVQATLIEETKKYMTYKKQRNKSKFLLYRKKAQETERYKQTLEIKIINLQSARNAYIDTNENFEYLSVLSKIVNVNKVQLDRVDIDKVRDAGVELQNIYQESQDVAKELAVPMMHDYIDSSEFEEEFDRDDAYDDFEEYDLNESAKIVVPKHEPTKKASSTKLKKEPNNMTVGYT